MTTLVTHSTRSWLPRIKPYLNSLSRLSPFENVLLTVDFDAHAEYMADLPWVKAIRVPKVDGSPEYSDSLQHGGFLPYVDGNPIVHTDGDIIMQREPTDAEINWLENIAGVGCGYNSGPGETLAIEATRLFPKCDIRGAWGDLVDAPCYNIGVFVARRATYQNIYNRYMELWPKACDSFGGPQRQQWLVCYVIAELAIPVAVMPYSIHTHGCYPLPAGVSLNGTLNYEGSPVLFRHHV